MPKIVVKVAVSGEERYFWLRILGRNGEIMMDSEEYSSRSNVLRAAKRLSKLTGLEVKE